MNKKQLISLAGLALGVTLLATPAFADTNTVAGWGASEDGKTDVTVTVAPNYTVTIPASFTFTATGEQGAADNIKIAYTSQVNTDGVVKVNLAAGNTFKATKNGSEVPFTISYGTSKTPYTSTSAAQEILSKTGTDIAAATADLTTSVYVNVASLTGPTTTLAGTHTGTVNFSVDYTPGNP